MNFLQKIQSRVRAMFAKRKLDAEMDEEMRLHVEMRTQQNIGAGLMLKSFLQLYSVDLGFNPERTLTLNPSLPTEDYPGPTQIKAFYREATDQIRALPGVQATVFANAVPLGSGGERIYGDFPVEGQPPLKHLWSSKIDPMKTLRHD